MKNGREKLGLAWRWKKTVGVAIAIIGIAAIGNVFIPQVDAQQRDKLGLPLPGAPVEAADPAKMAFPLPDKPSIAILPFDIISSDPGQSFLADGLTENITTALSRLSGLFVISRNSASAYKDQSVPVRQVAEDFGVRYVLEGSVQQSGEDLRVTAQLIDAVSGFHIWSERYDRKLSDVFDVQDEITLKIVQELDAELFVSERGTLTSRQTESLEAWSLFVQGEAYHNEFSREGLAKGRELRTKAVEIDPNYAAAWAKIAMTHLHDVRFGYSADAAKSMQLAAEIATKALALDETAPEALNILTNDHIVKREYDEAIAAARRVVALAPNFANGHAVLGQVLVNAGRSEEAVPQFKQAMRLWPSFPPWYFGYLGAAYMFLGEEEQAIAATEQMIGGEDIFTDAWLAMVYSWFDHDGKAREHVEKQLQVFPTWSIQQVKGGTPYKDTAALERILENLRRVGVPES